MRTMRKPAAAVRSGASQKMRSFQKDDSAAKAAGASVGASKAQGARHLAHAKKPAGATRRGGKAAKQADGTSVGARKAAGKARGKGRRAGTSVREAAKKPAGASVLSLIHI